jgi:UDP-N-acetylmuramyl pentapeptide phosphotransferase/UDP-N-acetylglucosamine-1-phosphate transferase
VYPAVGCCKDWDGGNADATLHEPASDEDSRSGLGSRRKCSLNIKIPCVYSTTMVDIAGKKVDNYVLVLGLLVVAVLVPILIYGLKAASATTTQDKGADYDTGSILSNLGILIMTGFLAYIKILKRDKKELDDNSLYLFIGILIVSLGLLYVAYAYTPLGAIVSQNLNYITYALLFVFLSLDVFFEYSEKS